ncbi:MAG: hypothetical protein QM790_05905 [Nibricoccus sp.]
MKHGFHKIVLVLGCLALVACQSVPKSKSAADMSDDERKAAYTYGPITAPPKEHRIARATLLVTTFILIAIPVGFVLGSAASGKQIHMGK